MDKNYELEDFTEHSFVHGTIEKFCYDFDKKFFQVVFSYLNLKSGGCLFECAITITDWWDLEVIEKGEKVFNKYSNNEIPTDIDQIFKYEYDGNTLTLKACGSLDIDTVIDYKFTKSTIRITGEYDPD